MKTISQRELRNDNAEIMRGVEAGESYEVTRRGVPVARLSPMKGSAGLRCVRPAKSGWDPTQLTRVRIRESVEELVDGLQGDR